MTVKEALNNFSFKLKKKNISEPELNAIYIISDILGIDRNELIIESDRQIDDQKIKKIKRKIKLKEKGLPLSWIIGKHNFGGIEIKINEGIFVPRPETEELAIMVNEYISDIKKSDMKVLDFCAGSGCISIYLAYHNPEISIYSVEKSKRAVKCIEENAREFNLENIKIFKNDNMAFLKEKFDIIVSNPPYIPSAVIPGLDIEVLMEPRAALDGGKDGLDIIREIERDSKKILKKDGVVFLEFGDNQDRAVKKIFSHWREVSAFKDINGRYRFLRAVWNG